MSLRKNCMTCGTPMSKNIHGDDDCPNCNRENFFGFPPVVVKSYFKQFGRKNQDVIDDPVFAEGQGVEVLVEMGE